MASSGGRTGFAATTQNVTAEAAFDDGVGHIVVGRSHQPNWKQLFGRAVPMRLIREAQGLDVHVVAMEEEGAL